ncbi:aminotransferase class I/II-fold pyridoxal phosphate-dependent enzyme [Aliarcobacter cryaerophilus]|uniref:aminotransferase class I/II-fold pyridoxal phosphate-dependent enzyme n=1 Tax=Aliarcobacter cryaerophilus TaxID=28198 RepID=UPI0021B522DD|nr:aminotransferase class I/II-fold pyridoxal phosphate-dependent enzyme [Aliarcobacter cryaerophilus]MCT7487122.1 aminotransferase class I/II-fold pyridoxal phosphate-dependent enzyme [Aliarcobacter cryaerophilus]MCT7491564.1 aminotransferase class I/II-fold pyridoxal phosphate-dependent enzyme [Aliarcobacter cryaerophilus]
MIKKMICKTNDSLIEVMKTINENAMGIAFVVDENSKLVGISTDGDIRQALLDGKGLSVSIQDVMNKDFIFAKVDADYHDLISQISHKVKTIPLVNDKHEVVDFFEYKQDVYFPVAIPNLNGNEFKYLTDAFMSTWISSSGEYIGRFENEFSKYSDCKYGVACSNGTVAIHLALVALGIGEGDEVIVPDLTFAATINTVLHANATPVIVDVEENSWCIDPKEIEKAITPKTKAIIPVHIYGQACDMDSIMKIAKKHNLKVIEDCAEAHGAMYSGQKVGSFGDIGCFSFYGNKVITTGEGGMCVTNSFELDEKMRVLRDHGMSKTKRYWHDVIGYNYRMTNLQAAIGLAQLERIEDIHKNRKMYEENYKEILDKKSFTFQQDIENRTRITWLASVLLDENINREDFILKLKEQGIDGRPFFYPLSDMEIYKPYCKSETPITHKLSKVGLNLPTYESLKSLEDIKVIMENL